MHERRLARYPKCGVTYQASGRDTAKISFFCILGPLPVPSPWYVANSLWRGVHAEARVAEVLRLCAV